MPRPSAVDLPKTLPLKTLLLMHEQASAAVEREARDGFEDEADAACDRLFAIEARVLETPAGDAEGAAGKIELALRRAIEASGGDLDDDWKLVKSAWSDLKTQAARARDALFAQAGAPALMAS